MSNYIFTPPQQNYHYNQKIDLGDIRVSAPVEIPEGISRVIFNNNAIVDMSYDTVIPEVVHNGYMFHAANGNICTGTYDPIDLTQDTVTPEVLMEGYTAHAANGEMIIGNASGGGGEELANSYTAIVNNEYRMGGSCACMFSGNTSFNQPVTIGDNITICSYMFNNCSNFNQSVIIPNNVINCVFMFDNCIDLDQNIYIKSTNMNVRGMLRNHNNQKQINIFCTNLALLNKTISTTSITGGFISWASMTNGYYNATYNIYLYNNLPAGI